MVPEQPIYISMKQQLCTDNEHSSNNPLCSAPSEEPPSEEPPSDELDR